MVNTYRLGDVLWGEFPCDDGFGDRPHPALVLADPFSDGATFAIVGTSQHVGLSSVDGQVVISWRGRPHAQWEQTGLEKPTGFDLKNGRIVRIDATTRAGKIGSIVQCHDWVFALMDARRWIGRRK